MKNCISVLGTSSLFLVCIMMMQTVFGQKHPYSQGFTNFEFQDDTILKFTTKPIEVDSSNCFFVMETALMQNNPYSQGFTNYEFQNHASFIESDTSMFDWSLVNKQPNTMKWQIPWKDGKYMLRIVLRDISGGEYICDTIIEHKCFCYWIVSVGTGDQQIKGDVDELMCAREDAETFQKVVEKAINQKPEMSYCLTGEQATKENILHIADSIGKDIGTKKEKKVFGKMAVFVYLGGHGTRDDKKNKEFFFQVNDKDGKGIPYSSKGWLSETEMAGLGFLKQMKYEDSADVWFFVDACESAKMDGSPLIKEIDSIISPYNNINNGESLGFSFNYYSSVITSGKSFKNKDSFMNKGDYCNEIKAVDSLLMVVDKIDKDNSRNLQNKAIHGLYINFFKRTLEEARDPVEYDALQKIMNTWYNQHLTTNGQYGKNDPKPSIPVNNLYENLLMLSSYLDLAIGYNISKQWNPQIGFSWKRWSVFVDCSINCHWTDSITHKMRRDTLMLPSEKIVGIGIGARFYPKFFHSVFSIKKYMSDLGLSLSAQFGGIYGEKTISEMETIRHCQNYFCLTPAASLQFYSSKNKKVKLFFNVGYSFYYPYSINKEMKTKPFVTNVGVSIPLCNKNISK